MNTHESEISSAAFSNTQDVRRKAELLRAEQTARIFRSFFRLVANGYSRLASIGANINTAYRTPKAMY